MKVYLDSCALQRPLDTKTQIRIALEAEAVLGILTLCEEDGNVELISSEALQFEIGRIPHLARKKYALEVLARSTVTVRIEEPIETRAAFLNEHGIKPLDALHLACAESAGATYFCTCDDKFLKKARAIADVTTRIVSPLELVEVLNL
jgi:predicted nucleic acid-binding protein